MRRFIESLVLALVLSAYAGSASAILITTYPGGEMSVEPSDDIVIDVVLNTEGLAIVGYQFHVAYDPAVLSLVSVVEPAPPGFEPQYVPPYPEPGFVPFSAVNWAGSAVVDQVVGSLVFHVMDAAASTVVDVTPVLIDYLNYDNILLADYSTPPIEDITLVGTALHLIIPEPSTVLLLGLGLLGIGCVRRRF